MRAAETQRSTRFTEQVESLLSGRAFIPRLIFQTLEMRTDADSHVPVMMAAITGAPNIFYSSGDTLKCRKQLETE